jgi:ferredoxin
MDYDYFYYPADFSEETRMKANVDKEACIGCGLCETICPAVFKLGAVGKSDVIVEEIEKSLQADCLQASENCPVSAIEIFN